MRIRAVHGTRSRYVVLGAIISLVLASCSGNAPSASPTVIPTASASVAGCVPECLPPGGVSPGNIPAGPYTTKFFFARQLTITFDNGWAALDDTTIALHFEHASSPDWHLFVSIDPYPIANLKVVEGIERTPEALAAWMQSDPALIATPGPVATIGQGIPATTIDVEVPRTATKDDPDCPVACTNFLGLKDASDTYGNLVGERTRIYLAAISYGGQMHLLAVFVEVRDKANFDTVLPSAQQIIDTLHMPVDPA